MTGLRDSSKPYKHAVSVKTTFLATSKGSCLY